MDLLPGRQSGSLAGLDDAEARMLLAEFGANVLPRQPARSPWLILLAQLRSFIVLLLLGCAGIAFALGEYPQAFAILGALLVNASVGFWMDLQAEHVISSLERLAAPLARVRRSGRELALPVEDLVPGDVIVLDTGDRIPADARLVEGEGHADESLLTGESAPASKRAGSTAFAGTVVTGGHLLAVVTATGARTELGRIGRMLGETSRPRSPLDRRLEELGRLLIWVVGALALLVVGIGLAQGRPPGPLLAAAIALAVAAIPEGLPSVATLALGAGVRRLESLGLRVRHLAALETLGGVTTLCLDKTGTLTRNAMTVERLELPDRGSLLVSGEGWAPEGTFREDGGSGVKLPSAELAALLAAGQLCNDATLEHDGESGWHVHGDPSEGALLVAAAKAGLPDPRREAPVRKVLARGPGRPWMLVLRELPPSRHDPAPQLLASIKGAPEAVLSNSVWIATGAAGNRPGRRRLEEAERAAWARRAAELAHHGLRVFALADRALAPDEPNDAAAAGWRFLGLAAMRDSPRPDAREMLHAAHRAGIRTVMITGDHVATARAIARDLALAGGRPPRVGTRAEAAPGLDVYARATPEGKLRLIEELQARGEVVAMTGDGVNDAPALRAAAAGVAMGRGTDVARDAASVVLVDESLTALMGGIREGRGAYLNIQKAADYLLTCSAATVLAVLIGAISGLPLPLGPVQILYLNLLMHTFPALGLALEPADPDILERPPLPVREWILSPRRLGLLVWHAVLIAGATVSVAAWGDRHEGAMHGSTLAFAVLAISLLAHAVADRAAAPFQGWRQPVRPAFPLFLAVPIALLLLAIYLPPLAFSLDLTRIRADDWLVVVWVSALAALLVELSKGPHRPAAA